MDLNSLEASIVPNRCEESNQNSQPARVEENYGPAVGNFAVSNGTRTPVFIISVADKRSVSLKSISSNLRLVVWNPHVILYIPEVSVLI